MEPISIVIPVSSDPALNKWLPEMMESIARQTQTPDEVVLVSDAPNDQVLFVAQEMLRTSGYAGPLKIWLNPWPVGILSCMNFGVSLAAHNLVILACEQDKLLPNTVQQCRSTWTFFHLPHTFYVLLDGAFRTAPVGGIMVTKTFWDYVGGLPLLYGEGYTNQEFRAVLFKSLKITSRDVIGGHPSYWIRPIQKKAPPKYLHAAQMLINRWMVENWRPSQPETDNSGQPLPEGEQL